MSVFLFSIISSLVPNPFPSAKIIAFSASQLELSDRVLVANESMISSIATKKSLVAGFKYSVASPSLMPKISKIARILGPRQKAKQQGAHEAIYSLYYVFDAFDNLETLGKTPIKVRHIIKASNS